MMDVRRVGCADGLWVSDDMSSIRVATMDTSLALPQIDRRGLSALSRLFGVAGRRRVFVISGPGGRHLQAIERELAAVAGLEWVIFAEARRHVPQSLVARASAALDAFAGDAVLSVGGGSATGLAKALRLQHTFFFVAVPTTYAGSELTDIHGTTSDGGKRTGRDARVVPDVALYDLELTLDMPLALSVTSLMNALAHPASALSTGKLDGPGIERALAASAAVYEALSRLVSDPRDIQGRRAAIEATVQAGWVLRTSPLGEHHRLAHALGGRFDLDHAGLHSVLLPHSIARLATSAPEAFQALVHRVAEPALPQALRRFLLASSAPTSLAGLGVARAAFDELLAQRPELPRELLEAAYAGSEPG
jgi:maleylacetate reductase